MKNLSRLDIAALYSMLLAIAACDPAVVEKKQSELATGFWRAEIELPGGKIDTGIEISAANEKYQASLINGQERIGIDEVSFRDRQLLLRFAAFNNEIRAELIDGELRGELILVKRFGKTQTMPFVARFGSARVPEDARATANIDMSGRWAVQFAEPDGSISPSIGEFAQRGSRLFGTFLNPNGDHRYLAGYVRGNDFRLSTFDGAHAFVFSGRIEGDRISGADFWSGTEWHQTWTAVRNPGVTLPGAYSRTHLKPGHDRFEFAFPDLDGRIVSLDDERFAGKVVIVTLAGTWCPNCHDEARFMAPLYKQYRDKGLEIVALMYEHFEDHDVAAEQIRKFREKLKIEYATLIAGISDKTEAGETLPSLNAVLAFPTTIFIDRGGRVRTIHTGFNGPGTGEHHEKLKAEMTSLVAKLLAEPANLIESLSSGPAPRD
jgi:thiol-disulfide isomerase/thioredoxin